MLDNTERKEYFKNYYQNNKDKYKKEYKIIRYCEVCEKEFINITRHRQTEMHQLLLNKLKVDENTAFRRVCP
jgi:ribosomal protein L34E